MDPKPKKSKPEEGVPGKQSQEKSTKDFHSLHDNGPDPYEILDRLGMKNLTGRRYDRG